MPAAGRAGAGGAFEMPARHQAQVDFGDFKFPWGKRYALLVVLAYSRDRADQQQRASRSGARSSGSR